MYNLVPLSDGLPICKINLPINNISYIAGFQGVVVTAVQTATLSDRSKMLWNCQKSDRFVVRFQKSDRYAVRSEKSDRYAVRFQHDLNVISLTSDSQRSLPSCLGRQVDDLISDFS